jgi:hypothetical protein
MDRDLAAMLSDAEFLKMMATEENQYGGGGRQDDTGWVAGTSRWIPYNSKEDKPQAPTINGKYYGAPTIGYGHKIFPQNMQFDAATGRYSYIRKIGGVDYDLFKGITDAQAKELLKQDIIDHFDRARSRWDKHMPMGKGDVTFDELPLEFKAILLEIDYNVGLEKDGKWEWPSLAKAMKAGQLDGPDGILNHISRTDGNGKQLGRVKRFQEFWKNRLEAKPDVLKLFNPSGKPVNQILNYNPRKDMAISKPTILKQLAQDLKDGMLKGNEFFKRFNKQGQVKLLNKLLADQQASIKAENDAAKTFGQILEDTVSSLDQIEQVAAQNEVEYQKQLEEQLQAEVEAEMAKSQPTAQTGNVPQRVDETANVITEQPANVEYFQDDLGEVIKMVNGRREMPGTVRLAYNPETGDFM